jgi:hypothetical protein
MDNSSIYKRDVNLQNEFKRALEIESINVYGQIQCYASKKPYKGLIASHIKPYKLCVMEGDQNAEYNVNNGILISSNIDAFFDKLDITFNSNGEIVFSDNVPDDIQKEFMNYSLDEKIFNDERKRYMEIHNALFYYKNYSSDQKHNKKPSMTNGSKVIKYVNDLDSVLCLEKEYWTILSNGKGKIPSIQVNKPVENSISTIQDPILKLKQENSVVSLTKGISFPNGTYLDLNDIEIKQSNNNLFMINSFSFNPVQEEPVNFIMFLNEIFYNDSLRILQFQKILGSSLLGIGSNKAYVFKGNYLSFEILFETIKEAMGNLFLRYSNNRILAKQCANLTIPNVSILYFENCPRKLNEDCIDELIDNSYFKATPLSIFKPMIFLSSSQKVPFHYFRLVEISLSNYSVDPKKIFEEAPKVLNWILKGMYQFNKDPTIPLEQSLVPNDGTSILGSTTEDNIVSLWLSARCEKMIGSEIQSTVLYNDYVNYCKENNMVPSTQTMFGRKMRMHYSVPKRSRGARYYQNIKLKD